MKSKLRVSAYCRVSTDKEDQVNSLAAQIKYFSEHISRHSDWCICQVYCDEGLSGTSIKKRAGFNRMIRDASLGKMDLILTKEVSRFARNTIDTLFHTRNLKKLGVGVVFMNDNIDTRDSDGELRLSIMATIAQEESRKTSERVKWGQQRRMEQGVVFGRDMLGYFVRGGKLIINPKEIETVKLIFHKFLAEGKGTHIIARELQEAGIAPKRAEKWSNTAILRVLRNEKYVGDLYQKKTYTPDFLSHEKKYNRSKDDMICFSDHHEPIIDRDTWDKTQAELKRRSPANEQRIKYSNRYWCSGKLICGECGQRFVSRTKKRQDGSIYKAWRCYAAANHGTAKSDSFGNKIGCNSSSVNEKILLACVRHVLRLMPISKTPILQKLLSDIKNVQPAKTAMDTKLLHDKIAALYDKKRRAIDLTLDGTISKGDLKQQTQFYDTEIEILENQLTKAENTNIINARQMNGIENYISEIHKIMDFNTENELLYQEILDRIVIYENATLNVYLKYIPFGVKVNYQVSGQKDKYDVVTALTGVVT